MKTWAVPVIVILAAILSAWVDMDPPTCPNGRHAELVREWVCAPDPEKE